MADRIARPEPSVASTERATRPGTATVTVGLIDGITHSGQLAKFTPANPDLVLQSDGPSFKKTLPVERVAYVGFHRGPGEPPPPPGGRQGSLKVYVAGGGVFLIDPVKTEKPLAVGFYALPADEQSPFREIFFYNHGLNAKEINQPLGAMLVDEGRLGTDALKRGLAQQKANHRVPIGQILVEHRKVDAAAVEQAAALQSRKRLRLGEVLIEAGLAQPEDIEFALGEQRKRGGKRIGQILVEMNLVEEQDLAMTLAKKFQLPFVDLEQCVINLDAVKELPKDFIEKHKMLPVDTDAKSLSVALSDPLAVDAIDLLRFRVNKQIHEVVATPSQLEKFIPIYLDQLETRQTANQMDEILKNLAVDEAIAGPEIEKTEASQVKESDNAVIKLANQIVIDAYRRGASDIHIEPNGTERTTTVRFRVDGECTAYQEIPSAYRLPLVARFKIMANLDISERRKPQDGKIRFRMGDQPIELRVATIPTVNNNEDIVLRILAASKPLPLEQMGLGARNLAELQKIIQKPYGLILCVGPTGSGKTTTLHSTLGAINTGDMKIWTAEDPVEITQPGLRQVQVNAKIGFTFANAMRAFLRADPDVIMVGEMRDQETAGTAVEASLTGHLVFSTLHTNSAPETITRLIDMGLDPFSFADALVGILAQRLARTLCKQCREFVAATPDELEEMMVAYGAAKFEKAFGYTKTSKLKLWKARGCNACGNTGYRGRIGIHELLVADDPLKHAIQHKGSVDDIRRIAQESGMTTLLQDGIEKALAGSTDMKQVLAVCSR